MTAWIFDVFAHFVLLILKFPSAYENYLHMSMSYLIMGEKQGNKKISQNRQILYTAKAIKYKVQKRKEIGKCQQTGTIYDEKIF